MIPFLDLKRQYKTIRKKVDTAIQSVLQSQNFILGKNLELFEAEFAEYLGAKYVVGVGSGTEGLILSLRALNVGVGDEVITPVNSFIATSLAITEVGATPVFVDVDKDTYQLDVRQVREKISPKTKVILPVHLYGAPCEIRELRKITEEKNIFLAEDACQAHGASYGEKKVGTFGDLGVFSFYPGKNLGAYGDGGAICTNNKNLYEKLIYLRNYGQSKKYFHDIIGVNSRLDEIQAAILSVKLQYLDLWNRKRREIASVYVKGMTKIKVQKIVDNSTSSYHLFVVESKDRSGLIKHLSSLGIQTLIHYPLPIHLQKCYSYLKYKKGDFPVAEKIADRILSIPIYPELTKEEVKKIIDSVNSFE